MNTSRLFPIFVSALIAILVSVIGCSKHSGNQADMVERGKYLVDLGSCNLCHTPKISTASGMEPDQSRLLSGHQGAIIDTTITAEEMNEAGQVYATNSDFTQWTGPWGTSFAANLTPDKKTGIGNWTEDDFIKTMRTGRHKGTGDKIQLPMPWNNLASMTDEDLKAIFAYLKSIKPIENRVPKFIPRENTDVNK
jgi:mono/diheme cytochrome c family protein